MEGFLRQEGRQWGNRISSTIGQLELGFLAHSHIGVFEQDHQRFQVAMLHTIGQQHLGFHHMRGLSGRWLQQAINASFACRVPPLHPIGQIKTAFHPKLGIGRQNVPNERFEMIDSEGRPLRLHLNGMHTAVGRRSLEINEEKGVLVAVRKSGAGVISQARGSVTNIGDRGNQIGSLSLPLGMPEFLGVPRTTRYRLIDELIADAPSTISTRHQINPPSLVASV